MSEKEKKEEEDSEESVRKALDDAMPMGVKASFHRNPSASDSLFTAAAGSSGGNGLDKKANFLSPQSGTGLVGRTPLLYVDPMFDPILFLFPKDRIDEINKRLRHYYETDPIVGSAIDMHCLPAGEPVFCNGGIKDIQDIVIGDTVVGTMGNLVKVTASEAIEYDGDIFDIKPRCLPSIKMTDTHPVMAIPKDAIMYDSHGTPKRTDTNNPHYSDAKWIMASSVREGDVVLFPKFNSVVDQAPVDVFDTIVNNDRYVYNKEFIKTVGKDGSCPRNIGWTREFSEILGRYVAEGSTSGGTITFSLGSHERKSTERLSFLIESVFGMKASVYEKLDNVIQMVFFSTPLANMFDALCGVGSSGKKIPKGILLGSKENAEVFLSAYLSGDDCFFSENKSTREVKCCTMSRELSYQLLLLGSKCGILFGHTAPTNGAFNGKEQLYQLTAHKNAVGPVLVSAGASAPELDDYDGTHSLFHQDDDYFYLKITRVGKKKFSGVVYDIETEDASFCAPFLVHNTAFPLSDFSLECEADENQQYWNDFKDRTGMLEFLRNLVHDYWLLGEGIGLPVWDEFNFEFSHFNQYPPENIDIVRTYVTPRAFFMLKPDPKLSEKVKGGTNLDSALTKMMDPAYVESLKNGEPYLLGSDDKVMYLARQTTKYRNRGVSILSRALKDLLSKDKLRLLQLTFVDRHMFPIKIFKLGSESRGWIPSKKHFQRLDALLKQASNDPDFSILYHFGLQVDYVGTKDKIWNLIPEFEWVERQVMAALFVNDEIVHGGMPSAVRDTVNMRTLMHRYMDVREKIERMMITHIFLPTARARGMYRKSKGSIATVKKNEEIIRKVAGKDRIVEGEFLDKENKMFRVANSRSGVIDLSVYDIPRPVWKKINLVNNASEQQLIMGLEDAGKIPLEMVFDMLGIDPRVVRSKMKAQQSTESDPLYRQIRDEIGRDKLIRKQVLRGKKTDEWEIPEGEDIEVHPGGPQEKGRKPTVPLGGGGGGMGPSTGLPGKEKPKPKPGEPGAGGSIAPSRPSPEVKPPAAPPPGPSTAPAAPISPISPAAPGNE
jgi:hypothetical protein